MTAVLPAAVSAEVSTPAEVTAAGTAEAVTGAAKDGGTSGVRYGHLQPITVHFDDLDALGMVHNARYAVLLERALASYWTTRGLSFDGGRPTSPDVFHVVREYAISFLAPIRGTGTVGVHFWFERFGKTGATYGFRFRALDSEDTVYAEGRRAVVRLDPATQRPTTWTDATREMANGLLHQPPPQSSR